MLLSAVFFTAFLALAVVLDVVKRVILYIYIYIHITQLGAYVSRGVPAFQTLLVMHAWEVPPALLAGGHCPYFLQLFHSRKGDKHSFSSLFRRKKGTWR